MSRTSLPSIKPVRYIEPTSFSDPERAARKLIGIANAAESVQDQRVHIELINLPFLRAGGSPGRIPRRSRARDREWLVVKFTQARLVQTSSPDASRPAGHGPHVGFVGKHE
jgi:hypothetical protein